MTTTTTIRDSGLDPKSTVGILAREFGTLEKALHYAERQALIGQRSSVALAEDYRGAAAQLQAAIESQGVRVPSAPGPLPFANPVCPFANPQRRRLFDGMLLDYRHGNKTLFHSGGRENRSNNIGEAFWRGWNNESYIWDKEAALYVAYKAGVVIAKAVAAEAAKRGPALEENTEDDDSLARSAALSPYSP